MSNHTSSCCGHQHPPAKTEHATSPLAAVPHCSTNKQTTKLVLRIEEMDCPTEEALIRDKLGKMPELHSLEFNLLQRRLSIEHSFVDSSAIIAAIRTLGMTAIEEANRENHAHSQVTKLAMFSIENMDCPTEERLIRDKLAKLPGITRLEFNLLQRKLSVHHTLASPDSIQAALITIDMQAVLLDQTSQPSTSSATTPAYFARQKWAKLALAGGFALSAEIYAYMQGAEDAWPVILLASCAILLSGLGTYKKGWIALKNLTLNINALMSIAVTGALLIGQWPEAAMVMVLFTLAEAIEALSLERARNAIRGLMAMTPDSAQVLQPDGSWQETPASGIALGATIRIAPGERIALDGEVLRGQSFVNQAPITGESMPVAKESGDKLFAGTINQAGSLEYRVTAAQTDSTLSRIIRAVEEAQASRAPTQRFVDSFAKVYTPIVFALALAIMLIPPLFLGLAWADWIYKALVLLVIACPCALVVSTPVTVVSGLAAAAKAGILIKGGVYLEEGRKLKLLALDKTGTITQGQPKLTKVELLQGELSIAWQFAASLAARSDHPVSNAISTHWQSLKTGTNLLEVHHFEALLGRGVKGQINGQWYYLGNHRMLEELKLCNSATEAALLALEAQGNTAVLIANQDGALAVLGVADTVRDSSRAAIAELHALGIRTVMLSGDNVRTAQAIAKTVGIDDARGNLLPEDKLSVIADSLKEYPSVGMVGDGINDAPALAKASIGFAMGAAGTDTALETADVALMDDDLRKIPQFIRLSQRTASILKQNIALALGIKLVFLVMAGLGLATLWMAVFADMGASLLVIFNGLRLVRGNK